MNDNEIRIAIAEACGLDVIHDPAGPKDRPEAWKTGYFTPKAAQQRRVRWKSAMIPHVVPDYTSDLNAMHEVLRSMDAWDDGAVFDNHLFRVLHRRLQGEGVSTFEKIRAEARELAEAFLKTKNLWKE